MASKSKKNNRVPLYRRGGRIVPQRQRPRMKKERATRERDFTKAIIDLAMCHRWLVHHTWDSRRTTGKGFPDIVMVRGGKVIWAELKASDKSRRTDSQLAWADALLAAGADYHLWTPSDMPQIEQIITASEVRAT